jgi:DNA replication protein DnaC
MNQTTVINKINDLNYQGIKEAYLRQVEDTNYNQLNFDERLYNLLEAQEIFTHNKRVATNLRASKIKDRQAAVEDIEYSAKRKVDKQLIQSLITMDFIRNHQNIIITGKTGTGKSYIAQAIANRAILDGFRVYYIRVPTLLEEIKISRADGTYTNLLRRYSKFKLPYPYDFE